VFKGFHAGWGGSTGTALHRILAPLRLQPARFLDNGRAHRVLATDALALRSLLPPDGDPDIVYLDPPYNQHPYASNYHVLDSIVLWDRPPVPPPTQRGWKAAIRADWRTRRSPFNDRNAAAGAFVELLATIGGRHVLVSYSTDGIVPWTELVDLAARHGALAVHARPYKRYRTSPTRPSPRPRTVELVLRIDRARAPGRRDVADVRAAIAALQADHREPAPAGT
jgi:adenine-specific DNA-methyltransferase